MKRSNMKRSNMKRSNMKRSKRSRHKVREISADLFSTALSKGDKEKKCLDCEFSGYSASDLDVKLLLSLIKRKHTLAQNICIPNFYTTMYGINNVTFSRKSKGLNSIRSGIIATYIHTDDVKIHMPSNIHEFLDLCESFYKKTGMKRFIFFNTGIYQDRVDTGHANAIIFDIKNHTIECYEPAGIRGMNLKFVEIIKNEFPKWRWISGAREMPHGVQDVADSFDGMCVTFSLYYTLLRLQNPDETPNSLYLEMHKSHLQGKLKQEILRLNRFACNEMRRLRKGELENVRMKLENADFLRE